MKQPLSFRSHWTALVPDWLRKRRALSQMQRQWRALERPASAESAQLPPARVFIVPPDTATLVGARGDEAMMRAIAGTLRRHRPDLLVSVLAATDSAETAARQLGFEGVRYKPSFTGVVQAIRAAKPDALVVIGADMMDGYYSPSSSAMRLLAADRLARDGIQSVISGFSFNADPDPLLAPMFDTLDPRVSLCVRDPLSLTRLRAFCRASATLVADPAFMLEADEASPRVARIGDWIGGRRQRGERVFGVNLHPSLFGNDAAKMQRLLHATASALISIGGSQAVSWLLIAHDFRSERACGTSLEQVEQLAGEPLGERLLRPRDELSAAELKAIAGMLDGVFTGRMHLAIAALGQGTPIACLTYQGKFQGLLEHFELPHALAVLPSDALPDGALEKLLRDFIAQAPAWRRHVAQRLPAVQGLSEQNLVSMKATSGSAHEAVPCTASSS